MMQAPVIRGYFDDQTNTITYLVWDAESREAVVIDPVLDYDPADGTVDTRSAERVLDAAAESGLSITHVLETHAHADHLSAAPLFKAKTGAKIGIGAKIRDAQLELVPYMLVVGGREAESGTVALRDRLKGDLGSVPVDEAIERLRAEIDARSVRKKAQDA